MFVEEHPYQTIVWYKPFASAQQVCCFQLWKRFSHSVPRDRQVCDLCEISCSRGDAGYGQPLSCPWSRSREVPRWKISSNLRHRAPRYISSWMGSEPTDTQRDPSCRIYRIRQDVSVCCLRLLCFLQFMYLYIYIFSDWLVWCLSGKSMYVENFRHFYSVQRNIHLYTVHCALTHDTTCYICPTQEKQNLKRVGFSGRIPCWGSYGTHRESEVPALTVRFHTFRPCRWLRFATRTAHAMPCHFAPESHAILRRTAHERKAPAAQRGSCSISCADAWAFTIWPC